MKKHANAQEELRQLYELAKSKGKAHTQKEFAELVGLHPANFSSFINGTQPVTEQMLKRIKDAAMLAGVTAEGSGNATQDIAGGDMQKTYNIDSKLTEGLLAEMAAQRELYAEHTRMQFEQIKQLTAAVTALASRQ